MTSAPEHRDHATAPIASRRSATFGLLILLAAVAVSWMRCGGHRMPPPSAIHPDIAAPPATQTALSEPLDAGTAMQRLPVRPSRWRVVDGGGRGLPGAVIVCSQPVRCVTAQDVLWQLACDADGHVAIPSTPPDALQEIVAAYQPVEEGMNP